MRISMLAERIKIYFEYYLKADTRYNIHPPFLSEFIDFVLDVDRIYYDFNALQEASEYVKRNDKIIQEDAFSNLHHQTGLTVSRLYQKAGHALSEYESLYRTALFLNSKNILELGSCTGIGAFALALANKSGNTITVEGNKFLSSVANDLFHHFKIKNARCIHSDFSTYLNHETEIDFDLIFLDGHHEELPTIDYCTKIMECSSDTAVIILDDIHWSHGMYKAWKLMIDHPSVQCSLETWRWGFLFKSRKLTPGNYVYIPEKFKPWKIGLFQ
jgi:hypothetical protein